MHPAKRTTFKPVIPRLRTPGHSAAAAVNCETRRARRGALVCQATTYRRKTRTETVRMYFGEYSRRANIWWIRCNSARPAHGSTTVPRVPARTVFLSSETVRYARPRRLLRGKTYTYVFIVYVAGNNCSHPTHSHGRERPPWNVCVFGVATAAAVAVFAVIDIGRLHCTGQAVP